MHVQIRFQNSKQFLESNAHFFGFSKSLPGGCYIGGLLPVVIVRFFSGAIIMSTFLIYIKYVFVIFKICSRTVKPMRSFNPFVPARALYLIKEGQRLCFLESSRKLFPFLNQMKSFGRTLLIPVSNRE